MLEKMEKAHNNPTASVLVIGNEILSGRTQDANIRFLGEQFSRMGINFQEARIIPDDENVIIRNVLDLAETHSYLFTTGGIGSTHDDITAASIAKAFNRPLHCHPEALERLKEYYGDGLNEARSRMALMPTGVELIDNPVSNAPGFQIENVFVLAGVPVVMQAMFETLHSRLAKGTPIRCHTITCNIAESLISDQLGTIQKRHAYVDIGSYPHFHFKSGIYGLSLVVRGTDETLLEKASQDISELICSLGGTPRIE